MALSTHQISTSRFLPPVLAPGIKGSISSHCSLVRLLEYTLLIALYGSVFLVFTDYTLRAFFTQLLTFQTPSKNKVIYHNKDGRIVLVLKKRFSSPKEDTTLARLDEDIQRITGELANKHSEEIADIEFQIANHQDAIEELEKQQAKLLSDRRIITLKKQYHEHRESTLSLDPNLSVFLN